MLDMGCPTCDPSKSFEENLATAISLVGDACPEQGEYLGGLAERGRIAAVEWPDHPSTYARAWVDPEQPLTPYGLLSINTKATNWLDELVRTLRHEFGHFNEPNEFDETKIDRYMNECGDSEPDPR
jgi:hypothetical protein